jgi:hypothetical protein
MASYYFPYTNNTHCASGPGVVKAYGRIRGKRTDFTCLLISTGVDVVVAYLSWLVWNDYFCWCNSPNNTPIFLAPSCGFISNLCRKKNHSVICQAKYIRCVGFAIISGTGTLTWGSSCGQRGANFSPFQSHAVARLPHLHDVGYHPISGYLYPTPYELHKQAKDDIRTLGSSWSHMVRMLLFAFGII